MLGTAASRAMTNPRDVATRRGAEWLRHSAMPMATGTAISSASAEDSTVPKTSEAMPNFDGSPSGSQPRYVRKLALSARSAGTALATRKIAIATMITSTVAPEAVVHQRNRLSGPNRRRAGSAPPPPRGDGGPVVSTGPADSAATGLAVSAESGVGDWPLAWSGP